MERLPPEILKQAIGTMKSRSICKDWMTIHDREYPHLFSTRASSWKLNPGSRKIRHEQHKKAEALGFWHMSEGNGKNRHVVLLHPCDPVSAAVSVKDNMVSLFLHTTHAPYHIPKQKKRRKSYHYEFPEEEDDGSPECMKCGFRTWKDVCPDCGRPVW